MVSTAVGWDIFEEMCKWILEGEEKSRVTQQATSDRFGRAHSQDSKKYPPRVANFNIPGRDLLGVKKQRYGSSPQTTPCLI